jgi:chromosome segregation ATPase
MLLLQGCASHAGSKVEALSLRDPRLPEDALSWLADAEDEVAIAGAQVDDAEDTLVELESYGKDLDARVGHLAQQSQKAAEVERLFADLSRERVRLQRLELKTARQNLEYAEARLTLARAETAVRYDLAVYEIEPLLDAVRAAEEHVAEAQRSVEERRAEVDAAADAAWSAYARFVAGGGSTDVLWGLPR